MAFGIQCCIRCGHSEEGHTGPGNKYLCKACTLLGYRQDSFGNVIGGNLFGSSNIPLTSPGGPGSPRIIAFRKKVE